MNDICVQFPAHDPFAESRLRMLDVIQRRCSAIGVTAVRPPQAHRPALVAGGLANEVQPLSPTVPDLELLRPRLDPVRRRRCQTLSHLSLTSPSPPGIGGDINRPCYGWLCLEYIPVSPE